MGGSSSKSKIELKNETYITNTNMLNQLSQTINETIVNVTVENVKTSSAALLLSNKIEITGIKAGEDINIVSMQGQKGMLDFASIQLDTVTSNIQEQLTKNIENQIKAASDSSVIQKMDAEAQAKTEQGWGAIGWAQSNSKVKEEVMNNIKNTTVRNLTTVVKTSVTSNFTQKNLSNCISSVVANQEFKTGNLVAGRNVTLTLNQQQAIDLFAKCVQQSDVSNQIVKNIQDFYNMQVSDKSNVDVETSQSGKATAETKMAGILDFLMSPWFWSGCVLCLLVIVVIIFIANAFNSGDSGEPGNVETTVESGNGDPTLAESTGSKKSSSFKMRNPFKKGKKGMKTYESLGGYIPYHYRYL